MNYTYYRRYRPQKKRAGFNSFFWLMVFLVILALILRACVSVFSTIQEEKRDEAILSINQGSAELILWGQSESTNAADSQILLEGDRVKTGVGSLVTLEFHNGTQLKLDENTDLSFTEMRIEGENDYIVLDLHDGRVWMDQLSKEQGQMEFLLRTDVLNIVSMSGQYLASNQADNEYLYVIEGQLTAEFVERETDEDTVIETLIMKEGTRSIISDDFKRALLAREAVEFSAKTEDELVDDEFVLWNLGVISSVEEEVEEVVVVEEDPKITEEIEKEEVVDEKGVDGEDDFSTESLEIAVISPNSGITIQDDAIAIEGQIISGSAAQVYVSWSGNGEAYPLGLFEAGNSSFRYVADVDYLNFSAGENIYTITAYDAEGNASNVLRVVINGDF